MSELVNLYVPLYHDDIDLKVSFCLVRVGVFLAKKRPSQNDDETALNKLTSSSVIAF